jgi:hypothetical protein
MSEKTLNEALSGSEIKEIILQEIGKRLDGDTTLENDLAYAGFKADFNIKIGFLRSLTKPTEVWGAAISIPEGSTPPVSEKSLDGSHVSADSPDIERQSHDLPIPVLMQTPSGMERKKVHIGRGPGRPPKVRE